MVYKTTHSDTHFHNLSLRPGHSAHLIFVTDATDGVCGEKIGHVENSPHDMLSGGKFLHMIDVGKLCHMEKFLHMRKGEKICHVEN